MKFSRKSSKTRKTTKRSTKRNYKKKRGGGFNVDKCINDKTDNDTNKSANDIRTECNKLNNEYLSKIKPGDDTVQQIIDLKNKEDDLNAEIRRLEEEQEKLMAAKNVPRNDGKLPQPQPEQRDYDDYYDEVDHTYDTFNRDNDDDDDDDIDEDYRRLQMSRTGQVGHVPYGKRVGKAATTTYRW